MRIFLTFFFFFFFSNVQARDTLFVAEIDTIFRLDDSASLNDLFIHIYESSIKEEKLRAYCTIGLEASEALKDFKNIYRFCICHSVLSYKLSDTIYLQRELEILNEFYSKGDSTIINENIVFELSKLGRLYSDYDMYYQAITNYHKAIEQSKKIRLKPSSEITSIGKIYSKLEDYDKSLEYFIEAKSILEADKAIDTINYHFEIYYLYLQMAFSYNEMNKKDLALKYAIKSEKHYQITAEIFKNNPNPESPTGMHYTSFSEVVKFYYYYELLMLGKREIKLPWSQEDLLAKIRPYKGENDDTMSKYKYMALSVAIFNSDIKSARRIFNDTITNLNDENLEIFAKYYELIGDYNKALIFQKKVTEQEKERLNSLRQKQVVFADAKHLSKQKEIEILQLEQGSQQQTYRSRLLQVGFGVLMTLISLIIYLFQQQYKQRQLLKQDVKNKKTIIKQSKELTKVNAIRQRSFTNIAHELRTPLTFIRGALKQLKRTTTLTNSSENLLNRALNQSKEVEQMVSQIMDLSRDKVKNIEVHHSQFDLDDLNNYLNDLYKSSAKQKEIKFIIASSSTAGPMFSTDVEKLLIILKNILSNALKFTPPEGEISLNSQINESHLIISIKDTGRGIAEVDLEYIFDRFYQAKEGDLPEEGGFGIGLAICQEYVHLLKGNISVESEFGKGSRFIIKLPRVQNSLGKIENYSFPQTQLQPKTMVKDVNIIEKEFILVVDDNLEMCAYLCEILESEYTIVTAQNGREALNIIAEQQPSLIITDLMMPVMDGMKLIQRVKENFEWSSIPILILTAKNSILDELKATRIGVDDYLMKPFNEDELKAHLYHLLELSEERLIPKFDGLIDNESLNFSFQTSLTKTVDDFDQQWLKDMRTKINPLINNCNLDVAKISEELGMSATHLTRKMKSTVGLTPKKYIMELRLLSSRKMLENRTYNSVKEVAYSVGFKSDKTFSRNFKDRFGKYPSEYLK